jgi:hypothetical protein
LEEKLNVPLGLNISEPAPPLPLTTSTTGKLYGLLVALASVNTTEDVYIPAVLPVGSTEREKMPEPGVCCTVTHVSDGVAVKLSAEPSLLFTKMVCGDGALEPGLTKKTPEPGLA